MGKTAITITTLISIKWLGPQNYYKQLKSKRNIKEGQQKAEVI